MADPTDFELLSPLQEIETIASGRGVDVRQHLKEKYGGKNWSKKKAVARVNDLEGYIGWAEVHWFEAHGVGRVQWKIKTRFGS